MWDMVFLQTQTCVVSSKLSRSHVFILSEKLSELRASFVKSLLASFGTEGEFLDADESHVLDSDEAQKVLRCGSCELSALVAPSL